MDQSPIRPPQPDQVTRLLARTPVVRGACELDLLIFLQRHPRTLLTNEQLAAFVGYDMKQVASGIEAFIGAGLLERTQNVNPSHAARMYQLVLETPEGSELRELLELASTREGRRTVLEALDVGRAIARRVAPVPAPPSLRHIA